MRIISGKNRGRRIIAPPNLPVRPTTDMAKESLFNILGNTFDFDELEVLDLFAGTGNIAFEFASRGCKSVTAVDINHGCVSFINQTAQKLNFTNFKTIQADYKSFMKYNRKKYHLIFADPPYDMETAFEIPSLVFKLDMLFVGGQFILEHDKHFDFSGTSFYLQHRKYGKVNFSFFENENKEGTF